MTQTRVCLEIGRTWVFASALDWPGWCRRGKGEDAALETLLGYADRYAAVVGTSFAVGDVHVVGRSPGNATTDFGAPGVAGEWDDEPLSDNDARRLADILVACWNAFDRIVAASPPSLRKGPRGGGRDRDAIVDHVREAERSYVRKGGVALAPRTPWEEQRAAFGDALRQPPDGGYWSRRYVVRRAAWHVLDHAWEIEDRRT
jgi:hypothetical protein